jgi:hypothetical protein
MSNKNKLPIEDLAWYIGENYVLVSYIDGSMRLFEMENEEEKFSFERQGAGNKSLCWINNMSGDFITSTDKVGALRIFNVA